MLRIHIENDSDGDNNRQDESSRTYSDHPVLGPGCEQFAVWAETYTQNELDRSFMDQGAVQQ